jgi:Cu-processing system permease protein
MDWNAIRTIAAQEIKINVRNKWMLMFAALFGGLSLAVCYFGLVTVATVGVQGFTRTTASLLNLVLYLVPLVALVMATLSFSGEKGALELLFSQPIARRDILIGKLLGLFLCILAATCMGFGLSGVVIATRAGGDGSTRYAIFVGLALLLALVFLSLGSMLAIIFENKTKAMGAALFLWFFFVVFYDLLAIGMTFLFKERTANVFIFLSLFGNPVDLVRVSSLINLGGVTVLGAAGAALMKFLGGTVLSAFLTVACLLIWAAGPLLISMRRLRGQDI